MNDKHKMGLAGLALILAVGYLAMPYLMPDDPIPAGAKVPDAQGGSGGDGQADNGGEGGEGGADEGAIDPDKIKSDDGRKAHKAGDMELPANTPVKDGEAAKKLLSTTLEKQGASKGTVITLTGTKKDGHGNTLYSARQTYKGVPIMGAVSTLIARNDKGRNIYGQWATDTIDLDVKPTYDAATAFKMALKKRGIPDTRSYTLNPEPTPKLIVLMMKDGAKLAWVMEGQLLNPEDPLAQYIVDAHTPEILLQVDVNMHE